MTDIYIHKDFSKIITDKAIYETIAYIRNGNIVILNSRFKGKLSDLKFYDMDEIKNLIIAREQETRQSMLIP